jgi:hypothetical protein
MSGDLPVNGKDMGLSVRGEVVHSRENSYSVGASRGNPFPFTLSTGSSTSHLDLFFSSSCSPRIGAQFRLVHQLYYYHQQQGYGQMQARETQNRHLREIAKSELQAREFRLENTLLMN